MSVPNWPPDDLQKIKEISSKNFRSEQFRSEVQREYSSANIQWLEDELLKCFGQLVKGPRDKSILVKLYGWDGTGRKTLEAVGKEFDLTRERVRQINDKFSRRISWKLHRNLLYLPIFDAAIKYIEQNLPALAKTIELGLVSHGISRDSFNLSGLITTAHLLKRNISFQIMRIKDTRFVVDPPSKNSIKLISQISNKVISHWGLATISDICAEIEQESNNPVDETLIITVLLLNNSFHWLDQSSGWFWLSSVTRNRLLNQITKILSISGQIDVSELRSGITRNHRMEGFSPPKRVLIEFCRQIPWCNIEGNLIKCNNQLNWEETLRGSTEYAFVAVLKEDGPVMHRKDLERKCLELGINQNTFYQYLSYSPILTKFTDGVYGLRGAKVDPGLISSLKSTSTRQKRLIDFGWTSDRMIWIGLKISENMILTGVFTIPARMKRFIHGEFILITADGTILGNLHVKDGSAWSLKQLFQRRGGEPDDFLVLTFDTIRKEAIAYIGDENLLDDFRPVDIN